jgi:tetratricopeptide (TPR) repeat protein
MQNKCINFFIALFIICLAIGCQPKIEAVSKDEALKFAEDMEMAAAKKDPSFFSSRINIDVFAERIEKLKGNEYAKGIKTGMREGLRKNNLEKAMFEAMGKNGFFERVKVYEKNKAYYGIFRMYGDGGINYYDIELAKTNGKVGIADMYIYAVGDNFSNTVGELLNGFKNTKLSKAEEDLEQISYIKELMSLKKFAKAKDVLNSLPPKLRNTRIVDVIDIQISTELDEATYLTSMQNFETKYGNDASAQLILLDMYLLRKEYEKAINAINIIDSTINKDVFLDYYRGLIYNLKGTEDLAIASFEKLVKNKPDFEGAYAELFVHYIEKGDKKKAKLNFSQYKKMKRADKAIIDNYAQLYPYLDSK